MIRCPACGEANESGKKFCGECGAGLTPARPAREVRKTVTVLFSDLAGSTALGERLDAEALRAMMSRYFGTMKPIVERHGGTVEKFIGDAIMAVFGIPTLHEDDALRAVRAASEMRSALEHLNTGLESTWGVTIAARTGINTGEVVAGDASSGQTLVTGDTVNTAARLEQAAGAGQILLGMRTYHLVRDAVEVEPVEPLDAKGKSQPLEARRLISVRSGAPARARRLDAPLIGRERELDALKRAFERAVSDRAPQLFTLLGTAGAGKSRLTAEFLDGVRDEARILSGRCLPYGEGITFWPIGEIVREAAGITDGDARQVAQARLQAVLGDTRDRALIASRVGQAIGLDEQTGSQDEMFWGIRKLLEALAAERPLVVVVDDIHWAEPTLLDLIEHIADWCRDAPLLLLCPARPDLLDPRPAWAGGKLNATTLLLEPLSQEAAESLITHLVGAAIPAEARARIGAAAEGNPLFVEEMVGMLIDEGRIRQATDGTWSAAEDLERLTVPPTIQALLAARLDRLEAPERWAIERASVVGRVFELGAVGELSDTAERPAIPKHVMTLVRKELVRPHGYGLAGEDAFRFRHLLIRDAAYDGLPKEERSRLHERFAAWLEQATGDRLTEQEEVIGYHLEQAHRYRAELGPLDDEARAVGTKAAARLGAAGQRALGAGDIHAATNLLRRACAMADADDPGTVPMRIRLAEAVAQSGEYGEAMAILHSIDPLAARGGDDLPAMARVARAQIALDADAQVVPEPAKVMLGTAAVLEAAGRPSEAARTYRYIGRLAVREGNLGEGAAMTERAAELASSAGEPIMAMRFRAGITVMWAAGPMPASVAIKKTEKLLEELPDSGEARAAVLYHLADLYAMCGRFDEARLAAGASRTISLDFGNVVDAAVTSQVTGPLELLAGDTAAAMRELRMDHDTLLRAGNRSYLSTAAALLAQVMLDTGEIRGGLAMSEEAERATSENDVIGQVLWRSARARALITTDPEAARRLAEDAVARANASDFVVYRGTALLDLAEVRASQGDEQGAREAMDLAIEIFRAKEASAYVAWAERRAKLMVAS